MLPMQGSLAIQRGPAFQASRAAALVAIGVLHAGLLALALQQRQPPPQAEAVVVSVSLIRAELPRVVPAMPRASEPTLAIPAQAVLLPADVDWESTEETPASAITTAVLPATPQVTQPETPPGAPLLITQAQYLRAPVLRYPPAALSARREGSVELRVLVAEDGRVTEVTVERSSGYAPFDDAACSAVRAALFKPYRVNGEPRSVLVRIPIDFTLKRRGA